MWVNLEQEGNNKNKYLYTDGTSVSSDAAFWKENEPNSANEKCVVSNTEGKWNDLSCNNLVHVLCQKEIGNSKMKGVHRVFHN